MKIAEGLLLRKQLEAKVEQLKPLRTADPGLFEIKTRRVNVSAEVDNVEFQIPKIDIKQVTAEYDKYATALRKLDAALQKANWNFDLDFSDAENPFNESVK